MRSSRYLASRFVAAWLALLFAPAAARADAVLNVAIPGDPGPLDPVRSGNYIDRTVLAGLCDKLIDTDPDMNPVPMLATSWDWSPDALALTLHLRDGVQLQDGTRFDADAVRANIERAQTLPGSLRRAELRPVAAVEVLDPLTVRLRLSAPDAPLVALLADRSGMMVSPQSFSPQALARDADAVARHPVCAGPFRFTERVAQDHITLDRFAGYWNSAAIGLDRVVYRPMADSTTRLVNLQTGQVQVAEQVAPNDVAAVEGDAKLRLARHTAAAYRTIQFNVNHGPRADAKLGHDPRVRQAFAASLDRQAINQVVFNGLFVPNNQTEAPHTRFWDPDLPVPARDLAGAKALLQAAGAGRVGFTLEIANSPIDRQIGEVVQAMAAEAGFDVKLEEIESNAGNQANLAGDFDAALLTWSGRADPDANAAIWLACDGPFNFGRYCDPAMDALLARGRATTDPAQRVPIYRQVAELLHKDAPQVILYNPTWLWGLSRRVDGFVPNQDGLTRLQGLRLKPQ